MMILTLAGSASGQATGQVTALGFNNFFRPDCWTPMLVQLRSDSNDARSYMIQVHQQDLDRDTVVYTRVVPLGPKATTDFWAYFIPQPTDNGLPSGDPRALADALKVYLYDEAGKTQIATLPITFAANNIDPATGLGGRGRGQKLILAVTGQDDKPAWMEYRRALGISEGVEFQAVATRDLPESVLGYQAIDAVVWFDANSRDVSAGGSEAFSAIEQYVKQGGQLVICQPADRSKIAAFADAGMLPVVAKDARGEWLNDFKPRPRPDLEPLFDLAVNRELQKQNQIKKGWPVTDRNWDKVRGAGKALEMFHASARPDAVVDLWINWDGTADAPGKDNTPYIARRGYGMGSVTWVAHDLGSSTLISARNPRDLSSSFQTGGWPYVWDKVFGWKNHTIVQDDWDRTDEKDKENLIEHPEYATGVASVDVGAALFSGMQASARGAWLVSVAMIFFVVYWIVAGPGSYFFLASKKRTGMSWTVFAITALVATAVTVGVVKLVLRGDPEVHHITVMRLAPGDPAADGSPRFEAIASSRFGLYIPRDGEQTVELTSADTRQPSYVIPLALHPQQLQDKDIGFTDTARYDIATDNLTSGDVAVRFPYRSTLKKIQTQWVGSVGAGLIGQPKLIVAHPIPDPKDLSKDRTRAKKILTGPLSGALMNSTGRDLHDIYIGFTYGTDDTGAADNVLFVESWPNGTSLDLEVAYRDAAYINNDSGQTPEQADQPNSPIRFLKGTLSQITGWGGYWYHGLSKPSMMQNADEDDHAKHYLRSFPLMAFFNRVGPYRGEKAQDYARAELLRRSGRGLDVSPLLAAGRLVVVAEADGGVAFPLKVNGATMEGEGITFFEVSLPLDRAALGPAFEPTTAPASRPAEAAEADIQSPRQP